MRDAGAVRLLGDWLRDTARRDGVALPAAEELQGFVRQRIADYKVPDRVIARGALPLTPGLKVDKLALRAELEAAEEAR